MKHPFDVTEWEFIHSSALTQITWLAWALWLLVVAVVLVAAAWVELQCVRAENWVLRKVARHG